MGHGRFPTLADGAFQVLGLLEDSNQRNKLFFRERVVINTKCCKVRADFLFLGAALKMYGLHQLLLHSGGRQVIVRGQSICPVFLPDVPQDAAQIVRNEMPEIFFLLYLRRFQSMEVQIVSFLAMSHQNHLAGSFQNRIQMLSCTDAMVIDSPYARQEQILFNDTTGLFRFEADVEFSEGARSFGLRFYENEETSQSYQYLFNIEENRYRFEKSPNMPWPANQNIGLERPIRLEAGKKYHIQMILDDTIATIYVDGVALNTRFYQKFGQSLSLFVTDGTLTVTNAGLSKTIK